MPTLFYNNVVLEMDHFSVFDIDPVMSDNGIDYLYSRVHVEVSCVWSPIATASGATKQVPVDARGKPTGLVPASSQVYGDRLGVSIQNLYETLMEKRKLLQITVGTDLTVQAPQYDLFDALLPCDCNNGPNPLHCKITPIIGDKTAMVTYGIECWISNKANIVLSNRWTIRATTTEDGYSRRLVTGTAILRADLMRAGNLDADDFRASYFLPVPDQFKRDVVEANLSDDGTRLDYTILDQEKPLAIGNDQSGNASNIMEVKATVSSSQDISITQGELYQAELYGNIPFVAQALFPSYAGSTAVPGWFSTGFQWISQVFKLRAYLPTVRAMCTVQVFGNRKAQKDVMAKVAAAVAMERLNFGLGKDPTVISAVLTQSVEQRFVQYNLQVIPQFLGFLGTVADPINGVAQLMKMANSVVTTLNQQNISYLAGDPITGKGPVIAGSTAQNTAWANARGTWLDFLLVQVLGVTGTLPGAPPANQGPAVDLPLE